MLDLNVNDLQTLTTYSNYSANEQGIEGNEEIKWVVGLFEWIERVQSYEDWDYITSLKNFVNGGMENPDSFIDTISRIFVLGCHLPNCSSREVTMQEKRRENFRKALDVFGLPDIKPNPTAPPTSLPTTPYPLTPSPVKGILPPSLWKPPSQPVLPNNPPVSPAPIYNGSENNKPFRPVPTPGGGGPVWSSPSSPQQSSPELPTHPSQPNPVWPSETPTQPSMPAFQPSPTEQSTPENPTVSRPSTITTLWPSDEELIPLDGNSASLLSVSWIVALTVTIHVWYI